MTSAFTKKAARAAIAGTVLVGLTAAGLALAAPASAAPGTNMYTGPLANATYNLSAGGTGITSHGGATSLANKVAAGTVPLWTYPGIGGVGTISNSAGNCQLSRASNASTSIVKCDDTALNQTWKGFLSGNDFVLRSSYNSNYLHLSPTAPSVLTYPYEGTNGYLNTGLALATPAVVAPSLASPLPNSTITPETVFSGAGSVNTTITVTDAAGKVVGSATVGADGTWSLVLDPAPKNGAHVLTVVALDTDGKSTELASGSYTMTMSDEERALLSPEADTTVTPDTVFSGTGHIGDTVVIKDAEGTVVGQTTVGNDGKWSTTLDGLTSNGATDLSIEVTGKDGLTEQLADNTYTVEGVDLDRAVTSPGAGETITPDTVFTGTGNIGDTIVITDKDGNTIGSAVVGNDGTWSVPISSLPGNGDTTLVIEVTGKNGQKETLAEETYVAEGVDLDRAVTSPGAGETITPDTVFTGTGNIGDTITIKDKDGTVLGETTVGNDGTWSAPISSLPGNGDTTLVIEVTGKNGQKETLAEETYVAEGVDLDRAITSPGAGETITPDTVFTGTGNIGDTVKIKDKDGTILGQTTVGNDGTWSTTLNPAPTNGDTSLVIEVTGKNGETVTIADESYEMEGSTTKFEVTSPDLSKDNGAIKNGTVFTGKGEPGTTVVLTDKDGNTIGEAVVDDTGHWSTPVTGLPQGPNSIGITHTAPGADPVVTDLGNIVVVSDDESTPLMDPAIAGGAALALLAAAGTILGIRRRKATQQ
ncbi:hypothetical protein IT072_17310 [Leifsonia sp. ZF2019]|uniref:Ig-like domain-containing protein n=1 Tax=Leifsonia sp. ZF2019 TaxID=2781978 RepID=UPI001CBB03F6|nr:Ig-like domain-containing protein [Leifsonia sp. ZF2019]UAJ78951.1 hypothetical protein IT072_17310 [Leifsonia sp. ZF2019]